MRDAAGPLLAAMLLRRRPFPRGNDLWILLDREGLRREILAPAGRGLLHALPQLVGLELRLKSGRGRLPRVDAVEQAPARRAVDPVRFAQQVWLAELAEIGLQPEDPHPELWPLLAAAGEATARPAPLEWGAAAEALGRIWGIWAPPPRCPGCGASPDGRPAADLGCAACHPLGSRSPVLTCVGGWRMPLARLLDQIDGVWQEALHRRPEAGGLVRDLGRRGLLS